MDDKKHQDDGRPFWVELFVQDIGEVSGLFDHGATGWLLGQLHPENEYGDSIFCPRCSEVPSTSSAYQRWAALKTIRCTSCQHKHNWKSGTPFAATTLTPGQIVAMLLGFQLSLPTAIIAEWTGLSPSSVRGWRHRVAGIRATYGETT